MPVSTTTARVSVVIPDAHALSANDLVAICQGAKAANVSHVTIHVRWNLYQSGGHWWSDAAAAGLVAVQVAAEAGLKVGLVPTGPIPSWATNKATLAADYANFVATLARNVKAQCQALGLPAPQEYQLWHWPNVAASWGAAPDPAEYTGVLKAAYPALKAVDPALSVIFGSLAPVTTARSVGRAPTRGNRARRGSSAATVVTELTPVSFLSSAYQAGAKGYFDVLGYTPVSIATPQQAKPPAPSNDAIKQSDDLRAQMVTRGDGVKKIHWTVGYDTAVFTETQQMLYLSTLRSFAEVRKDHVTGLNLYTYRDLA